MDLQKRIEALEFKLTDIQKKNVHFKSFKNFVLHLPHIKLRRIRIINMLTEYFTYIEADGFTFTKKEGYQLGSKFLLELGKIYKNQLGFARISYLGAVVLDGILIDGILFITGFSKFFTFLPIMTLLLLLRYLYVKVYKEKHNLVFGYYY